MSKRTAFPRRKNDCYDTPPEAVEPLIPHLPTGARYWEPCAGRGALIDALADHATCVWATDIEPRGPGIFPRDAMRVPRRVLHYGGVGWIISNPPFPSNGSRGRPTVAMIERFASMRPTWMLLPWDFFANRYAAGLPLAKLIPIGRVSWMGNGKPGFENSAWALFDARHIGPARFFPRAET